MRNVKRLSVLVPTLKPDGSGGGKAAEHLQEKRADSGKKLQFSAHWNNTDVRGALYAQHGKVCSYCGCHLPRNDRGDVEHYRPKGKVKEAPEHGGYWWLAYAYENYFISCSPCNRTRKGFRFPLRPRGSHVTFSQRHRLRTEARLLLDPVDDPVENWLWVDWQSPVCRIKARDQLSRTNRIQVEGMLKFFRINLDRDLLHERSVIRDKTLELLENNKDEEVRKKAIRYAPHSLVVKQILEEKAPYLLPSLEQELQWLLKDIGRDLFYTLAAMEAGNDKKLKKQADESLWSFAALLKDPLTNNASDVESFLIHMGIKADVEERFDQL